MAELNHYDEVMLTRAVELVDKNKEEFKQKARAEIESDTMGMDTAIFMDIATYVKEDKFEDAFEMMMAKNMPIKYYTEMCVKYLNKGEAFKQYVEDRFKKYEETAQLVENYQSNLDEKIETLRQHKIKGENVYLLFHGKKLYSMTDDENSCYLKTLGKTRAEVMAEIEEEHRRYEEERYEKGVAYLDKMYDRVKKGKQLLPQPRHQAWEDVVMQMLDDGIALIEDPVDVMLDFIKAWKQGATPEELDKILDSGLERPYAFFSYLKKAMGPVIEDYLSGYFARHDEKVSE